MKAKKQDEQKDGQRLCKMMDIGSLAIQPVRRHPPGRTRIPIRRPFTAADWRLPFELDNANGIVNTNVIPKNAPTIMPLNCAASDVSAIESARTAAPLSQLMIIPAIKDGSHPTA